MSKTKTREELEKENNDLVRILAKRKDAGASATIKELTELVSELRTEVTQLRSQVDRLKGKNQELIDNIVKAEDEASDAKEALASLVQK